MYRLTEVARRDLTSKKVLSSEASGISSDPDGSVSMEVGKDEDQPLDMSRTSSTIHHKREPEDEQKLLFSGLHLLVTAVGILERRAQTRPVLA